MATVKIKFRPSIVDGEQGTIFYQVIHNRVVRHKKTNYRIYGYEWNNHFSEVILPKFNETRKQYLSNINDKIQMDVKALQKIISKFEQNGCDYTATDVIAEFISNNHENYLFSFMEVVISNLITLGKTRTSETYAATLSSFKRFRQNQDLALDELNSDVIIAYETYLKHSGVSPNSSSFYMRNLRAVYNRAVEKELTTQRYPFKHVYTGVDKTVKRAVPLKTLKQIKEMDLTMNPTLTFARDMFLFSFYTRGMSFIDMAYLRKKDLNGNILSYRRRKTGQQLFIKWEKCMQEIVKKYNNPTSPYLLPIINPSREMDERKQYIYTAHNINRSLKAIGKQLDLSIPLTMYVSRHAWASIAKSKNVPISVISEGMGHDSEATTRIYLASLDTTAIDKANSLILKALKVMDC